MNEEMSVVPDSSNNLPRQKVFTAYAAVLLLVVFAVVTCSRSIDQAETSSAEAPDTFNAQFAVCLDKLQARQPGDALNACKRAAELDPDNAGALHNFGYAQRLLGDYAGAEASFRAVLDQDPLNIRTMYELASTYLDAGRTEDARATFQQVLEIEPNHGWARQRLTELGE